ncbi:MAG TPA: glycine--tRNA ligase subunit beta [Gammaproteobacteria bacterium]|nr:glycine--tRNA ligase subunit beta [Gammaproteobacteria bacterium]
MKQHEDLLIEIGAEELPPEALDTLAANWAKHFSMELEKQNIVTTIEHFSTPRRLALLAKNIPYQQTDRIIQKRGPALSAAFDAQNNPTKATLGFAKSNNVQVEQLEKLETEKGSWLIYNAQEKGQAFAQLLPQLLHNSLQATFKGKKTMRWADKDVDFLRPVHWCVILHGTQVITLPVLGVESGQETYGHRVHHPKNIRLNHPQDYVNLLRESYVLASYAERKAAIEEQINKIATSLHATPVVEPKLLDLVTNLTEWPKALVANFDPAFLEVPAEVLITAMQHHQKSFALRDHNGNLLSQFILIANIDAKVTDKVIRGNERVMQARLNDARFFYVQDKKIPLIDRLTELKHVIFQHKLGTLFDKTQRVKNLMIEIYSRIAQHTSKSSVDKGISSAERAALLSRCDLLSKMVLEFPELQGIMGSYYAKQDNEETEVAQAIQEMYYPRFSGDKLPESEVGLALSISDKLDTLVGIFSIGQAPTGDKDPFALRRQAVSIVRMLLEKSLALNLQELISLAASNYASNISKEVQAAILNFCLERARSLFVEQGIQPKIFEAVHAICDFSVPLDFQQRLHAVANFTKLPESESLAASDKRVRNILLKSNFSTNENGVLTEFLIENAEKALFEEIENLKITTQPLLQQRKYQEALSKLAKIRTCVDAFFDNVMVNVEDPKLRQNRIHLLANLNQLFSSVADISKL